MPTREEMSSLAEEIVGSCADRIATIADLRETVKLDLRELRIHLQELRDFRVAVSREIRADLARSVTSQKREVADMLKGFGVELKELSKAHSIMSKELKADLAKNVADCKREVSAILNNFSQARTAMSRETRADLARGAANCKRDVGNMLNGFDVELKAIRSELAGARDEWQILTATMQAQRVGLAVEVKPQASVEEVVEEKAVEITPEIAGIRDQVFEYLANHPDGTKMAELEQEFGLARIQVAKVVRSLMDDNKVEKGDMLYFAI